jgi:hypothetical protein
MVLRILKTIPNKDYLNLKVIKKRISCFISKSTNLDVILKLHRKFISKY